MEDLVNAPSHYTKHNITKVIEPIELCETCGFLLGNAFKYLFRYQDKGSPVLDLQKARFYLERFLRYAVAEDPIADVSVPNARYLSYFSANKFVRAYMNKPGTSEKERVCAVLELIEEEILKYQREENA